MPRVRNAILSMYTDEWGGDDFRLKYRQLECLRIFTGQEVPIVSCMATATTSTFNIIWDTLGHENQPFWGLDVGCDRPQPFFTSHSRLSTQPTRFLTLFSSYLRCSMTPHYSTQLQSVYCTLIPRTHVA